MESARDGKKRISGGAGSYYRIIKMAEIICPECGFKDECEPDKFGLNYYEAVGKCPVCDADLHTKKDIKIRVREFHDD